MKCRQLTNYDNKVSIWSFFGIFQFFIFDVAQAFADDTIRLLHSSQVFLFHQLFPSTLPHTFLSIMLPHLLFPLSLKDEEADDDDDDDDEYADVSDGLPSIDGTGTGNLVFFFFLNSLCILHCSLSPIDCLESKVPVENHF